MTKKQWKRVREFAMRMARIALEKPDKPRKAKLDFLIKEFLGLVDWEGMTSWDTSAKNGYVIMCDDVQRFLYDMEDAGELPAPPEDDPEDESEFHSALSCCVRAAMDVVCEPSAGVGGFTVGEVRAMWAPERVPQWVKRDYKGFDAAKDSAEIWL